MDCGDFSTCAVGGDGIVRCWGRNKDGELGQHAVDCAAHGGRLRRLVDRTDKDGLKITVDLSEFELSNSWKEAMNLADTYVLRRQPFGKLLPSVSHWKANAVLTWRPSERLSLTTAARYASRNYAALDNSDTVGNTYQGFYKYFVIDMRAVFHVNDHFDFALGVDNLNNDKYYLFHPFPQRSLTAQVNWKL